MTSRRYRGTCHCGNIQLEFESTRPPDKFRPRSCDCSFCVEQGAQYVSDPQGKLIITVREDHELNRYRQGSESAEFLICRKCGGFGGRGLFREHKATRIGKRPDN